MRQDKAEPEEIIKGKGTPDAKDPTINVQNLLSAAVTRQNDLREAESRRIDEHHKLDIAHLEARIVQDASHIKELLSVHTTYEAKLAEAEAKRIDAIRVVDVNAVNIANDRAVAQASVLAQQVSSSANVLRELVAQTASTLASQLQSVTAQLSDRLTVLERISALGQGKEQYTDPLQAQMLLEIKALTASIVESKGKNQGASNLWGYILGAVGLISAILAIASRF